jgi:hypothetical protein
MLMPSPAAATERWRLRAFRAFLNPTALPLDYGVNSLVSHYNMAFLDSLDVVVIRRGFVGRSDEEAMAHARTLCRTHTIQVSQGERLVGRIFKGGALQSGGSGLWTDAPKQRR